MKASQFSFSRLHKADPVLGVDMSSTGEVGCIGDDFHEALLNSMIAVGFKIPTKSVMFSSGATKSKVDLLEASRMLAEKGYEEAEIAEAVEKLMSYGYIDDERYASSYIRNQMRAKGRRRITMELSGKGVDSEMTRELCMELVPDEAETIYDLLERRYGNLDFSDEGQMRRMYSFFARRGFKYEDIRRAVSEYRKNIEKI